MIPVPDFKKEVFDWAEEIGVQPKEIHIRKMTKKWASCSTGCKRIRKKFINFTKIDYNYNNFKI